MSFPAADALFDTLVRSAVRTMGALPHRSDSLPAMAQHLRGMFDRAGVRVVLDVGARNGGYRDFLRRWVGFDGLIVSFEPDRPSAARLTAKTAGDTGWVVYEHGLGNVDGPRLIEVPNDDPDSFEQRYERVSMRRLDSVLPDLQRQLGFEDFFLKCDSLGRDRPLLEGAEQALHQAVGVQIEVGVTGLYKGRLAFTDSVTDLRGAGFAATGLFVLPKERRRSGADFDCVMLRDEFTPDRPAN